MPIGLRGDLDSDELGALITAIHRTSQLDLPVVLVGAGLPQLPGLAGDAKSYAERLFEFPLIGSLGKQDALATMLGVKVESVVRRRSGLIQKGMVYSPAHGDTAFTVPLFDQCSCDGR
jgi:hypothetical protein